MISCVHGLGVWHFVTDLLLLIPILLPVAILVRVKMEKYLGKG